MKINMVLASLFVACVASNLMGMQHGSDIEMSRKSCLNLLLDSAGYIKKCSTQNLGRYDPHLDVLLGVNIIDALPLDADDRKDFVNGLYKAAQHNATIPVPYALDNKYFLASIKPIIRANNNNNFFIQLQWLGYVSQCNNQ